ncbi:hypothetical protein LAZ67_10004166 [Cordylochernes scorpioides]|uniref:Cuticle protein 14 n=1 Tax=Cordylochernes scorpioides TaxID=51811 RepID=A0ABY6KZ97_9ARAC|nr:hypothetical protein LAZ67_10004166 [Cordylochernes scorpioides]
MVLVYKAILAIPKHLLHSHEANTCSVVRHLIHYELDWCLETFYLYATSRALFSIKSIAATFAQFLLVLSAVVAAASAHGLLPQAHVIGTGASSQFRSQDNAGNYAFGYDEGHLTGGTFRRESGSHGVKVGSYGLRDADGRVRTVSYVADAGGFRANIQTNEPGVDSSKDPAATLVNKHAAVIAAPAVHHASYVAPAHHAAPAPYWGGHWGWNGHW